MGARYTPMNFRDELKKLETERPQYGLVYIIGTDPSVGICKIGVTRDEETLDRRLHALELSSPLKLRVIHTICCGDRHCLERALHFHFRPKRSHGEWFHLDDDELSWLSSINAIDGVALDSNLFFKNPTELVAMSKAVRKKRRDEELMRKLTEEGAFDM